MFKIKIKTTIKIMGDTKIGHEVKNQKTTLPRGKKKPLRENSRPIRNHY